MREHHDSHEDTVNHCKYITLPGILIPVLGRLIVTAHLTFLRLDLYSTYPYRKALSRRVAINLYQLLHNRSGSTKCHGSLVRSAPLYEALAYCKRGTHVAVRIRRETVTGPLYDACARNSQGIHQEPHVGNDSTMVRSPPSMFRRMSSCLLPQLRTKC